MDKIFKLLIFIVSFSCASKQTLNRTDTFLSEILENPTNIANHETPSRYITIDKFLVHFISNINEKNKNISPIIYIHGLGGSLEDFSEIIKLILVSKKSAPFYAIDLPPFGKSFMNKSELSIHKYSELLRKFISMLPNSKVNLVCHSMGGQVCLDFSLVYPDKVQLLTLIDPAGVYQRSSYINQTLNHYAGISIGSIEHTNASNIGDMTWYNQEFIKKFITNNPLVLMAIESYKENFMIVLISLNQKHLFFGAMKIRFLILKMDYI